MGSTPLGFDYPDPSSPVNVPASVEALADSVDAYLTPDSVTVAPTSPYGGGLRVLRVGPMVVLVGGITYSGAPPSGYQVIGALGGDYTPVLSVPSPGWTLFGAGIDYQLSVQTNGQILFRHSAATGSTMSVNLTWLTAGA